MRKLGGTIQRLVREERGGSLFEYAVMLTGVALLAFLAVRAVGGPTQKTLQQTAATFTEALGGTSATVTDVASTPAASGGGTSAPNASVTGGSAPAVSAPTSGSGGQGGGSAPPAGTAGGGSGGGTISVGS